MRIMATSDLHGNLEGLDPRGADVVVLAGDIAPLKGRGPWHINDQSLLCGHIHTGQHGGVDFESTSIYNVSRLDERYEIAYEPTWVEI